jgi:hypothetical protein
MTMLAKLTSHCEKLKRLRIEEQKYIFNASFKQLLGERYPENGMDMSDMESIGIIIFLGSLLAANQIS